MIKRASHKLSSVLQLGRKVLPALGLGGCRRFWRSGFTLVELLVVVAIVGMLLFLATPAIVGSLEASQLTNAGSSLTYKLSLAHQSAVSRKKPVEVRFYTYAYNGVSAVRGYQLFVQADLNAPDFGLKALDAPEYFGDGTVVGLSGMLSPLLQGAGVTASEEPWASRPGGATCHRLVFFPDGSTNLILPYSQCFLTLAGERELSGDGQGTTPSNYFTIQLDPITGKARSYRP